MLDNPELSVTQLPSGFLLAVFTTDKYMGRPFSGNLGSVRFIMPLSLRTLGHDTVLRPVNQSIDCNIPKSWIEHCRSTHDRGEPREVRVLLDSHSYIDCNTRQVVPAHDNQYTALSYVWGDPVTSDGLVTNPIVSSALPEILPRVIEDAIAVTLALGYRYLWVDRYCISSQDASLKHQQISKMDQVYKHAEVTLISAAGLPSRGLPGVANTTRASQHYVDIGSYRLLSILTSPRNAIMGSSWATRGWTMQEAVLSNRRLFFTDKQMYFECVHGSLECESLFKPVGQDQLRAQRFQVNARTGALYNWIKTYDVSNFWRAVHFYSPRELTYQSDALNACLGLFRLFEDQIPSVRHHWGIPFTNTTVGQMVKSMHYDLQKQAPPSLDYVVKNDYYHNSPASGFVNGLFWTVSPTNFKRRPGFPSWSWAGWQGHAQIAPPKPKDNPSVQVWVELDIHTLQTLEDYFSESSFAPTRSLATQYIQIYAWVLQMTLVPMSKETEAILMETDSSYWNRGTTACAKIVSSTGKLLAGVPFLVSDPFAKSSTPPPLERPVVAALFSDPREHLPAEYTLILEEHQDHLERIGSMGIVSEVGASMGPHYGTYRAVCKDPLPWTRRLLRMG